MDGMFYKLPKDLAARKDLKASDKIVFAVIRDYQGENEICWPGVRTLSRATGLAVSSIVECVRRLEAAKGSPGTESNDVRTIMESSDE